LTNELAIDKGKLAVMLGPRRKTWRARQEVWRGKASGPEYGDSGAAKKHKNPKDCL